MTELALRGNPMISRMATVQLPLVLSICDVSSAPITWLFAGGPGLLGMLWPKSAWA